jgi:hypothetical protein
MTEEIKNKENILDFLKNEAKKGNFRLAKLEDLANGKKNKKMNVDEVTIYLKDIANGII